MVPGFGMVPGNVVDEQAKTFAQKQAALENDKTVDFGTWRKVGQQSVLPGLPVAKGDMFDWVGLSDLPSAKYADAQSYRQQTDEIPEQYAGQDWLNNVLNQWNAGTYAVTTQPWIPATPKDKQRIGIPQSEDARFSIAELGSYAGQILNQTFNPMNPNRNLLEGKANEDKALAQLKQNYQFRTAIDNLPPDKRDEAWMVWVGTAQSNKSAETWKQLSTIDERAAVAKKNMELAQSKGDATGASRWGQEYDRITKQDMWSIIEDNQNPWAEMIYGTFADPVDWVSGGATSLLGMTPALAKSIAMARKYNISDATAAKNIQDAIVKATPLVEKITGGKGLDQGWHKFNPFERTTNGKAYVAARELYETAMILTTGITNKTDARAVVQNWVEKGGVDLVNGLGLQKPIAGMIGGEDNLYRVGAGVLGNKDIVGKLPILQAAKDDLYKMKSLQGTGVYKPTEFLAEFGKIIGDTAGKAYRTDIPENLAFSVIAAPSRILRGILSAMYLNLRPANLIRQGTSQFVNLAADGSFSLRPMKNIIDDVVAKNGGLPVDMRLNEPDRMFGEVTSQRTLAEMFKLGKDSLPAKLERWGAERWGGSDTIGGVLPVGENSFYANAYGTTFLRTFNEFWKDAVTKQYIPELMNMGMEPTLAKEIADQIVKAGVNGKGKVDVANKLREITTAKKWVPTLPIPQESMLLEHEKELYDILGSFLPGQEAEAARALDDLWRRASAGAADILNQAPPSMTPSFTSTSSAQDAKEILGNIVDVLQRTGVKADAVEQAKVIVGDVLKNEAARYGQFINDLAQAGDPKALNFAFDVWGRVLKVKTEFRKNADAINKAAMKAIDGGADHTASWQEAYKLVTENWQRYNQDFATLMDGARVELLNGTYKSTFDWSDTVKRYQDYDTRAIEQARQLVPYGTRENAAVYEQVIDANRQFIDHAYTELFSVFKAMPTVESFDIIGAVMRHADAVGASAWSDVRKLVDEAEGTKNWDKFYEESSAVWRSAHEASVTTIQAAKRAIVYNYIVSEAPSKLKWTDDFAGNFQLLAPSKDKVGTWLVKDDKGRIVELTEEGYTATGKVAPMTPAQVDATYTKQGRQAAQEAKAAQTYESGGAGVTVPKNIIADYNRVVNGDIEGNIDDVLEAIPGAVTDMPEPVVAQAAETVAEVAVDDVVPAGTEAIENVPTPSIPQAVTPPVAAPTGIKAVQAAEAWKKPYTAKLKFDGKQLIGKEGDGYLVLMPDGSQQILKAEQIPADTLEARRILDAGVPPAMSTVAAPVTTAASVRKAASTVGIGTANKAGKPSDLHLIRSINKHASEMGLTGPIKKLDDLTPEDAQKVVSYYADRAAKMGKQLGPETQTMAGGLGGASPRLPNWAVPRWRRASVWETPTETGKFFPDDDAYESLKQGIKQARAKAGAPQVGDMALEQLKAVDDVRKYVMANLPQLLAGKANTLTPAQQLQVMDLASKLLMPAYDNVLRASQQSAKGMANFAMMDFNDRRNVDTLLAILLPFHYYWTRSAGNWVQRVMAKPQWLDFWLESQRAMGIENDKPIEVDGQLVDKPERLRGTLPNPLKEIVNADWMPDRIQNPTTWGLPFEMYLGYNRADEPDTESQVVKFQAQMAQYFAEKMFPWYQAAAAKAMDEAWPLPKGEKRLDTLIPWGPKNSIQLGDYFPPQRMIQYGAQAAGALGQPSGSFWSGGDEWDAYLIGRQIRNATQTGDTGPLTQTAQYAQQMVLNVKQGKPAETGIPADQLEAATAIYKQAVQAEGGEKLGRNLTGWLTGFTNQYYPEAEQEFQAGADNYYNAGYGPENLGGSKEARYAALEATPALPIQWGQKSLVPGAEVTRSPAIEADISTLKDERSALYDKRDAEATAAGEAAAKAGKDVYDARSPVYDKYGPQIEALDAKITALETQYPRNAEDDATLGAASTTATGTGTFTPSAVRSAEDVKAGVYPQGMNPDEFKQEQVVDVYQEANAKFPYNDNASGKEKHATAVAKEQFVVDKLVTMGYTADEAKKMYADNKVRDLSPIEQAAVKAQALASKAAWEERDAQWAARGSYVTSAFGADAYKVWDAYFDLPKDSAARQAYKDAHPELRAYNLAAYQPDGYKFLADTYGQDAVLAWANTPKWTEDPAQQAIRTAYLDANPKAWTVNAWVNGRPEPVDPDSKPEYNYGKDYNTAEKMFGADIWDKVLQYRTAGKEERKGLFKSLGLADWSDWWYGLLPEQERRATLPAYAFRGGGGRAFGGGGGGGGYGGGSGGYGGNRPYIPQVDPRGMDWDLLVKTENIRPWRKEQFDDDWMFAGSQLKPTRTNWR
jgi:hypothetical protein